MAQRRKKKVAVVQCNGGHHAETIVSRDEITGDCKQIMEQYPEGILQCKWGCLGGGSCVNACKFDAIFINDNKVAQVDEEKCVGCGLCAKVCPKEIIKITSDEFNIQPACVNQEVGAETRKECSVGCIACGICVKNCPADAITIEENHAVIHENRCIACGMCAVKCPRGTIVDTNGIFTVRA
ncbi:MAG: 4Fe-4S binding protein [Firmicutes bacterium]|uniref:Ferredoxin n=1 Tax=Candidatus Scybalomonas excrementavium TaxID=2840943 RepID=A0A9D9N6X8_9FIRM|nr:4Fe-4S binding protein [Candidatus Scybalomonas excrementavium]